MRRIMRRRASEHRGASAIEYALIAVMIAGAIVATVTALGPVVADAYFSGTVGW